MKEAVYEKYQEEIVIEAIDLEDPETLALFAAGDTKGFSNLNRLEPFAS